MGNKKLKKRSEIDQKYKWKIEAMYADDQTWQADIDQVLSMAEEFSAYQGRLTESAAALSAAFQEKDALWQKLEKAYVYARMKQRSKAAVHARQGKRGYRQGFRRYELFHAGTALRAGRASASVHGQRSISGAVSLCHRGSAPRKETRSLRRGRESAGSDE